jgi:hypothetical protein
MAYPNVSAALVSELSNDSGVSALVGTKVYRYVAPAETELPYVVFTLIGGVNTNEIPSDILNDLYQLDCWGSSHSESGSVFSAVYAALHEQELTVSGGWTNYWMACETRREDFELVDGKEYHRHSGDFRINVNEDG